MMEDEGKYPQIILPSSPWWLLKLVASRDEPTPFHLLILYHWQFGMEEKPRRHSTGTWIEHR